ncbi:Methyltransferase domain-containing protein [Desulfacinum hydrothermale DSM 13146]|uniref:Methyltransferase domain-containing protein n=1 Tax=Desulfacinum hydrothermale DSM 13146 TaxID=1121390 RepID=A0A1W1XE85_9BACT|nr:methyltransferase domain-containing protein [Desulfacinum hydrothermale]SMC22355.1 Methyltransferase domain-containing protein [Desulfacinum hydrothermale DSM 13146]
MADEYGTFARYYDWMEPVMVPVRRVLEGAVAKAGCRRVLDVCCGTGTQVAALRREGVRAVGLDLSQAMLNQAVRKGGLCGTALVRGDATRLPFPGAAFDGLILSFALHEKPAPIRRAMLVEAHRVLKPAGRLFVLDYAQPVTIAGRIVLGVLSLVERRAGRAHYRCFREYLQAGGTDALLSSGNWTLLERRSFWKGTAGLYLASFGHTADTKDRRP